MSESFRTETDRRELAAEWRAVEDMRLDLSVADILARHGVAVEAERLTVRDVPVADALISLTAEQGAGLLVMGAYGRPRLRELIMGGTTRGVLEQMTVPVLLSH